MVAMPPATAITKPLLLTVAANVLDEVQVTRPVTSWLVPSEYAPEATNCWVNPTCIPELVGVTDMEDSVAGVTVKGVLPEIVPDVVVMVAVMVAVPAATVVARPVLLIVATDVFDEVQVTCAVISWLVPLIPSKYAPEAANCWVSPTGALGFTGVTDMEDKVAAVTVRVVAPVRAVSPKSSPEMALMMTAPGAPAVDSPLALTVPIDALAEV
jgi:hypothetical protein